jgi:hypothetical protein
MICSFGFLEWGGVWEEDLEQWDCADCWASESWVDGLGTFLSRYHSIGRVTASHDWYLRKDWDLVPSID